MNQGFRYNLINQISLYAGFIPNHSVKTEYGLFFHTKNTLISEYQGYNISGKTFISLKPSIISTNVSIISTNCPDFNTNVSMISTNDPVFNINDSKISTNVPGINLKDADIRLNILIIKPNSPNIRLNISTINLNISKLLRDNAFTSGFKAIVSVCTFFRKWKKAFPINRELFLQWDKNLSIGKTVYFNFSCLFMNPLKLIIWILIYHKTILNLIPGRRICLKSRNPNLRCGV